MSVKEKKHQEFAIQDCALAAIATGKRAYNLREFRDRLLNIDSGSIYYHFWGGLLRPRFDDPEYHNDFAIWARYGLEDAVLAERLGIIDPTDFTKMETLREKVIEVVEERLDESEQVPASRPDHPFYFVRSQIVVFDTHLRIGRPEDLADTISSMSLGSIFFHFVDARRRTANGQDDFRPWINNCFEGYDDLCGKLGKLDPFFSGLTTLRKKLTAVFCVYFGK
jgi:hypothetical protein